MTITFRPPLIKPELKASRTKLDNLTKTIVKDILNESDEEILSDAYPERPIIFSGSMVRAILSGEKTMTRRVVKPQRMLVHGLTDAHILAGASHHNYSVGMKLWVRETWQAWHEFNATKPSDLPIEARERINYPADGNIWDARQRPSIHMPRWASRLTLLVRDVRVQRLQDISEADAVAEGVMETEFARTDHPASICFSVLWNSINGARAWERNDWVYAITFSARRQGDRTEQECSEEVA